MMPRTLVVTNTSQLVTVAERDVEGAHGTVRVIEDGALAAREGRIVWVGLRAALPAALAADADVLDAGGRLVIPGFVDAHTHPIFAGQRAEEFWAPAIGPARYPNRKRRKRCPGKAEPRARNRGVITLGLRRARGVHANRSAQPRWTELEYRQEGRGWVVRPG